MSRRLPIYLLIDCSGSMDNEAIEAVRVGVDCLVCALQKDPTTFSSAYLSVITFAGEAEPLTPLTPLSDFQTPVFSICYERPGTMLGAALSLLEERVKSDVQKKDATHPGDWLPLVYILTDGSPSDIQAYHNMARRILNREIREIRPDHVIACGAGAHADYEELHCLTQNVLSLNNLTIPEIKKYFKFASFVASSRMRSGSPSTTFHDMAQNMGLRTITLERR